ncbi:MAG: glycosyltransferase family 2 protein [Candidatus Eremiobacterota bacterium]
MEPCLVTIAVPVYNVENYLDTCIKSLISQTYENIEIILVNDGSTDSSLKICNNYLCDNRISIIDKKNEGLSSARQAGIDKAKGDYICLVDSDDYLEKDFVEKMYSKISAEKSDICVCASRFYSERYNKIYGFSSKISSPVKITKNNIENRFFSFLGCYYASDSWNKIYKTDFLRQTGVNFSLNKEFNGTDLLFNHCLILHLPQVSVLNEPLYNHQILNNSRVRRKNKQLQKGFMVIMSQIINEVEKLEYSDAINKQLNCLYVRFLRIAAEDIFSEFDSRELKDRFNEFFLISKQFLLDNPRLSFNTKHMNTLSLKIFCYCLKNNSSFLLKYLRFRQKTFMLLNKLP